MKSKDSKVYIRATFRITEDQLAEFCAFAEIQPELPLIEIKKGSRFIKVDLSKLKSAPKSISSVNEIQIIEQVDPIQFIDTSKEEISSILESIKDREDKAQRDKFTYDQIMYSMAKQSLPIISKYFQVTSAVIKRFLKCNTIEANRIISILEDAKILEAATGTNPRKLIVKKESEILLLFDSYCETNNIKLTVLESSK